MKYFLVIDVGTSSIRIALIDDRLAILKIEQLKRAAPVIFDAEKEWQSILLMMKKILHNISKIEAVSVSSLLGWVGVDVDKNAVTPCYTYMHQCLRQYQRLRKQCSKDDLYAMSYRTLSPELGGLKLMYLKEEEPERYAKLDQFLSFKDFINAKLTGQTYMDIVSASYTMLYDLKQCCWSKGTAESFKLDSKVLPELRLPTQTIGTVSTRIKHELAISGEVPVACASVDGSTGILGAGGVKCGTAVSVMGTTDVFFAVQEQRYLDQKKEIITNPHVIKGAWLAGGPMGTFSGTIDWLLQNIMYQSKTLDEMNALAAKLAPGCDGLVFLPALAGERTPFWAANMQGTILGIQANHRAEHMFRSIMEANCYTNKVIVENLKKSDLPVDEVIAIGGGSNSDLWLQMKADILGIPTKRSAVSEASLLGACMLAMKALDLNIDSGLLPSVLKTFKPNFQLYAAYQEGYQRYLEKHAYMKQYYEKDL